MRPMSPSQADLDRLRAVVKDRNPSRKCVWQAQVVLLSAEGVGTNAIMRETGKAKTCVWRWRERFAAEGMEGLLRDKTRPARVSKLAPSFAERVVELTFASPPGETTHWTSALMAMAGWLQRLFYPVRLARAWAPAAPRAVIQAFERP